MFTLTGLIILGILVLKVQCFTPNCVAENQFKFYSFPVEGCSEIFKEKCKFHPDGYFNALGNPLLVKIMETEVLPTCAFFGAENVRTIYGVNSKIKVLASGAFMNLPNVEGILLSFNHISDLRKDVFKNVSVEVLDLSWNKIAYIDSQAFKEIKNLKSLNLSKNSLATVPLNSLSRTVNHLNLAYNLLTRVAINSNKFVNLTHIDLSNNRIKKIAISFDYPVKVIDFTNNHITNFDYVDMFSVEKFKISQNHFERVPEYIENVNAKEIDIYPNPWQCEQLFLLWEILVSYKMKLAPKQPGKNPPAECVTVRNRLVTSMRSTECQDDHECPTYMACRAKKCWDPCDESFCHKSSVCNTQNHQFSCSCSQGLHADPLDVQNTCKNVECYTDAHCTNGKTCWFEKCIGDEKIDSLFEVTTPLDILNGAEEGTFQSFMTSTIPNRPPQGRPIAAHPELPHSDPWWLEDIPNVVPPLKPKHTSLPFNVSFTAN